MTPAHITRELTAASIPADVAGRDPYAVTLRMHAIAGGREAASRLSQRHKEVMSAYRDVIDQDSVAGRAARAVRDDLLAMQERGL